MTRGYDSETDDSDLGPDGLRAPDDACGRLLADAKERLLVSGLGLDRLAGPTPVGRGAG